MKSNTAELVFVPGLAMGHLLSNLELAKLILRTNEAVSISIYIINLSNQSAKIIDYVDSQSRNNPYPTRLTFQHLLLLNSPDDPSSITELFKPLVKQAVEDRVRAGFSKPVGFVFDLFSIAMVDIANELAAPSYAFYPSSAASLNLLFYALSLADNGVDVANKFSDPGFSSLMLGFKYPVTSKVIPLGLQDKEFWCEILVDLARKFRQTKGILLNTYTELEPLVIQALLNNEARVYPVGPILELDNKSRAEFDTEVKELVIQWLDCQPKSSVVFLCFGSTGTFDDEQVKEIANVLDKSGYRFLWVLKQPPIDGKEEALGENETFLEALPEGFVDRTSERGKIIGWAPQVEVLAHPAIHGFVSHCGWNSILESLWYEVPMATWPMCAEQQLNAFELVKELELAIELRMDYKKNPKSKNGNFLVTSEEIEKAVDKLMNMDERMRKNVKKMSDIAKQGLNVGGSSYNYLGRFIDDVFSNVV